MACAARAAGAAASRPLAAVRLMNSRREGRLFMVNSLIANQWKLHGLASERRGLIAGQANLNRFLRVEDVDGRAFLRVKDTLNQVVDLVLKRMMAHVGRVGQRGACTDGVPPAALCAGFKNHSFPR